MNNTYLLVTVDSEESVNQPALTTALAPYRAVEFITGTWMVETDQPPLEFVTRIRSALNGASVVVVPFDRTLLDRTYFPDDVREFLGLTQAA